MEDYSWPVNDVSWVETILIGVTGYLHGEGWISTERWINVFFVYLFHRTVLLRLASLGVLMIKIYAKVDETCEDNPETCCQQVRSLCAFDQIVVVVAVINITKGLLVSAVKHKGQTLSFLSLCSYLMLGQLIISLSIYISCFLNFFQNWENEIASQMYMLIWLDFFSHIFSSLVVTSVRK